jgi:Trp operon repressor
MSEDQFTKLFKYMQAEFETTRNDVYKVRQDVQRVYEVLDGDVHQREVDEHERLALSAQIDRLEERISTLEKNFA